jgi:D-glycero-D-manno-heptose 1,7-bisphosphate phosphatase
LELFTGVGRSIKKLNDAGFLVIIITNQSGIARGYFDEKMLDNIHLKLKTMVKKDGAHIDGIYFCPHHPDDNCDCRKPKPYFY